MENILDINSAQEFRQWLFENHDNQKECWLELRRGKPVNNTDFWYIDAIEQALCFGWIDSTLKNIDGKRLQRFSPRRKGSPWTELNKERVRRLESLNLMTDSGRRVLPPMDEKFKVHPDIEKALKKARLWTKFNSFPPLYQRVRAYNIAFYKSRNPEQYKKSLERLIEKTKEGKMYGEWNDYGRLLR